MKKIATTAFAIAKTGKLLATIIASSIVIHVITMGIDFFTIKKPLYLDLDKDFVGSVFSFPMIPMIIAYGLLILVSYVLWFKMKKSLIHINEIEMKSIKKQAVINALQKASQLFAKHINEDTTALFQWMHDKKEKGQQIPVIIEQSFMNISMAVQALNKVSYLAPYDEVNKENPDIDLENIFEDELKTLKRKTRGSLK